MDAIQRYLKARGRMDHEDIPNQVLRDYLDTMRLARKYAPGLHDVNIVITQVTSPESINRFREGIRSDIESVPTITVRG